MKLYKYTNKIDDFNIREIIAYFDNEIEMEEYCRKRMIDTSWNNYEDGKIEEVEIKKGVVLENCYTD